MGDLQKVWVAKYTMSGLNVLCKLHTHAAVWGFTFHKNWSDGVNSCKIHLRDNYRNPHSEFLIHRKLYGLFRNKATSSVECVGTWSENWRFMETKQEDGTATEFFFYNHSILLYSIWFFSWCCNQWCGFSIKVLISVHKALKFCKTKFWKLNMKQVPD